MRAVALLVLTFSIQILQIQSVHPEYPSFKMCPTQETSEELSEAWTFYVDKVLENTEEPGMLVRDVVALYTLQLRIYTYNMCQGEEEALKMRVANGFFTFAKDVVDNFKMALKKLDEEHMVNAPLLRKKFKSFSHANPEDVMLLQNVREHVYGSKASRHLNETYRRVWNYIDARSRLIYQFIYAYPLLVHSTKSMAKAHDEFLG